MRRLLWWRKAAPAPAKHEHDWRAFDPVEMPETNLQRPHVKIRMECGCGERYIALTTLSLEDARWAFKVDEEAGVPDAFAKAWGPRS